MSITQNNKEATQQHEDQVILMDKFMVPQVAEQEFVEKMNFSSKVIKRMQGLVEYTTYVRPDKHGKKIYITIAIWKDESVLKEAKKEVQTEYKNQDFNPAELIKRLNIKMDRNIYKNYIPPDIPDGSNSGL